MENAVVRRLEKAVNEVEKAEILCNGVRIAEMECLNSGIWSVVNDTVPVCKALAGCTLPSTPRNGDISSAVGVSILHLSLGENLLSPSPKVAGLKQHHTITKVKLGCAQGATLRRRSAKKKEKNKQNPTS